MNKGLFRLIFSTHLGMFVPAAESVVTCAGRSSGNSARSCRRALAVLLAATAAHGTPVMAEQPAGLVQHATMGWTNAGIAGSSTSQMTIKQTASKAILNWQQLNLNKGETLTFDQGGNRTWAALNRIHDANPSLISGNVKADGHLYFINSNGIIFGNGAQINVGSLTASTLDITDKLFNNGILSDPTKAVFSGTGGFVTVEQGAALTAATGGRVMLLAKNVTNHGVISTPDGQTILAAGEKVYLAKSDDPAGLLVEVDAGGTATNLGEIIAQRGNVTLVGLAVNQEGVISASTSVRANGSIYLKARDTATKAGTAEMSAKRGGVVTLGKDSTTTIAVETNDKEEALDEAMFDINAKTNVKSLKHPSHVEISGGVIDIEGSVVAHGGNVTAKAAFDPSLDINISSDKKTPDSVVDATRIYLGQGALIDVSGIDASAPMSRNQLEIQLYSDQLKDAPLQRGGPLFGKTIYVDARKDTGLKDSADNDIKGTALTDIQPYLELKGKTIAEDMANGGTVNLGASSGDVVLHAGSEVNVSGGSVTYEAGYMKESTLSYQGKTVAISQADPNTPYEKIADTYSVTDSKWGVTRTWALNFGTRATLGAQGAYNAAYSEGRNAGKTNITAANAVLQGKLKAVTHPGVTQRNRLPEGGAFNFTLNAVAPPTFRLVTDNPDSLGAFSAAGSYDADTGKFAQGSALPDSDILLSNELFANGFSKLDLKAGGAAIVVDAAIHTAPKGSVSITTDGQATVNADIVSPGGTIAISGGDTALADHVTISASGLYTNDTPGVSSALQSAVAIDGGSVIITEKNNDKGGLMLGDGVLIKADAGAWLKSNGKLSGGKGGNVTLSGVSSLGNVDVSAYGFSKGGSLTLNILGNLQAGGKIPAANGTMWLQEAFFGKGGFEKYILETSQPNASILIGDAAGSNTEIHLKTQKLAATGSFGALPSGADMANVASPVLQADGLRAPASVTFNSKGSLTVAENAIVKTDAPNSGSGGEIGLQSVGQMTILGSLIAPAGKISATINGLIGGYAFDNTLSLFIGESARLLATGYYAVPPSNGGSLANARVLNGGAIKLDGGDRGVVVAKQGSLLDVSGVSGQADIANSSGYTRQTLYGSAGNINISSRNALALDGDLHGNATGTGAGGMLTLNLKGGTSSDSANVHPNDARALTVTQNKSKHADGLNAGDVLDSVIGQGAISAKQIADGGFDRLSLGVDLGVPGDKIVLPGGLDLKLPTALALDAALLEVTGSGTAQLTAPHTTLTNFKSAAAPAPITGNATLQVNADFIDLINSVAVTGVSSTQFSARQDIRGRGTFGVTGSLTVPGEMVLSARQIYPATNSKFQFEAVGAGNKIKVQSSGKASTSVLSAGGELTLKADEIEQGGVLRAPLGQITLDAANTLTLGAGSLTSVSSEGLLIPYGLTGLGGLDWFTPSGQLVASDSAGIAALPEKKINLKSAVVKLQPGATVDISGGGDVLAYEFIKGIGGSQDILGQAGVYAVMPSMKGEYAPFDYSYNKTVDPKNAASSLDTDLKPLKPGDAVYLSAVPGLAAGTYTLLPARYALLPGAFMVQTGKTQLRQGQSVAQPDGSTLVSGYRTTLADTNTNRDSQWNTFKVTDGSIFRPAAGTISKAPAEYRLTTGNQFFTNLAADAGTSVPRLASDAGQLTLDASNNLMLGTTILTDKASGARGALIDIVSSKISVVSAIGADDGTLQLTAGSLNALHAESLLLGGTRTQDADGKGMSIATKASTVAFANDAIHPLEAPELIAAAKETLTVNSGAAISTLATTQPRSTTKLHASGDGALLAVSALNDIEFDRTGVSAKPVLGVLDVVAGANIQAQRSLVLDSTLASKLDGDVDVSAGGSATLGASRILLGDSGNETGLKLDDAAIANLGDVAKLTLNSRKNIDIYGPISFGNRNLNLTVNAGGIAGHLADNQAVTLTANNFVLENSAGASYVPPAGATGVASSLDVNANSITLAGKASSKTTIGGFDTANLNATGEVNFKGAGSTEIQAKQTNITSARITAATGADYTLTATGAVNTAKAIGSGILSEVSGLGAKLRMVAASIGLGGNVELPSGQFTAQAITGNLTVADGASIKAASVPVKFDKFTEHTPGGSVTLQADAGNVAVETGSTIDVSGSAGSDAGMLKIIATGGSATVNGTLKGEAGDGQQAGNFVLDTKTLLDINTLPDTEPLPGFSGLNTALNSGGFTASRDMRIRSGDVTIAKTDTVTTKSVVLSTDAGTINVEGKINASGETAGSIALYGGTGVTLDETAKLDASATAAGEHGGKVEIATLTGSIDIKKDSTINVSGGANGAGGKVYLRAPRDADNTDIKITSMAGTVTGASTIRAEGFKTYNDTSLTSSDFAKTSAWYADAEAFLKSVLVKDDNALVKVGLQRLGKLNDPVFTIVPGVEIRNSAGDLTLANEWSLHDWRFDPATGAGVTDASQLASGKNAADPDTAKPLLAGVLTLRAKGNLKMDNALSDGFSAAKTTAVAQGIQAWSYNLVAGADDTAANPLSTVKGTSSVTIGSTVNSVTASAIVKDKVATISATVSGYTLAAAPIVAFTIEKFPAGEVTSTKLKIGSTTKDIKDIVNSDIKDIVNSDGTALTTDGIVSGTTYFAQYNATTDKYQLFPNLVRTGAGDIRIASGGDVKLAAGSSVIYTAGRKADELSGFVVPASALYLSDGGDIAIRVQGNIDGKISATGAQQFINHWLFRQGGGSDKKDVSWWVRPDQFKQGVAAFGGGNVLIEADGNITNFSASIPTTARHTHDAFGNSVNSVIGGGDLSVQAGGDINSGVYFAGKGDIRLSAGGEIKSAANTFGTTLALQDASAEVFARKNALIETVFNPTLWAQATANVSKATSTTGDSSFFLTYGQDSAFRLNSLTGDVTLGLAKSANITGDLASGLNGGTTSAKTGLEIHPATVEARAFDGNINVGRLVLAPAAQGNLSLLAAGSVKSVTSGLIAMSDADVNLFPSVTSPLVDSGQLPTLINYLREKHAGAPVHLGDEQPLVIVARDGSILLVGDTSASTSKGPGLSSPKAAFIHAGLDISLNADLQHSSSNDITVMEAGRGFSSTTKDQILVGGKVQLSGPGELLVQAGRNVSLGKSLGIVSTANTTNPALSDQGASITVLAGLGKEGANLADYINAYINPAGGGPAVLQGNASKLAEYRQQTARAVTGYMRKLSGNNGLSDSDAMTQYLALDGDRQAVFAYRHFSSELLASGKGFAESKNHNRGDNAIVMLFPAERKYDGDILMYKSQLHTSRDGSIDLLAPGGLINVGLPEKDKDLGHDIGMVTEKGGAIRALAEAGFQVNESRVITQYGSDITVWVNNGDIDAGRGSKTAVSVPERVVSTDVDGNTTIEVKGAAAGSGIRAQTYDLDGPNGIGSAPALGSVALIAPRGILNAGEAGIAAGNFLAVATLVKGGDNIQISGSSSGVPVADSGSLAGSLAGVNNLPPTGAGLEEVAKQVAQSANNPFTQTIMPSFITVDVIGLGE